jgi:hypothetical protein
MGTSQDTAYDGSQDTSEDASYAAVVERLHDQVEYLRSMIKTRNRELEARTEELRRKDHIIAALTERIRSWSPPGSPPQSRENPLRRPPQMRKGYRQSHPSRRSAAPGGVGCSSDRSGPIRHAVPRGIRQPTKVFCARSDGGRRGGPTPGRPDLWAIRERPGKKTGRGRAVRV